jgi:hypothetical protein
MFLSKYGVARHIYIPIVKRGVVDFAVGADWTPAAGDVKISKDGGAAANVTNLPTAITMGNTAMWDFSLTATEMQAAQIKVTVADAATKAVEDQMFVIETYGDASAQHAFDLDTSSVAQTGDSFARLGAPAGASIAADLVAIDDVVDTEVAAIKAKTDQLTFTVANKVDANPTAVNGDATAAANLAKTTRAIGRGTVTTGASTTSIPTSAMTPSGAVADQFKGRIITFDADTATTALRGQSTDITASSNAANPTFTVTALTTAPASGDTFSVT